MSDNKARRAAIQAEKLHEKSRRMRKEIEMTALYRSQQGEIIGNMAGGFGEAVGGKQMQRLIKGIQTVVLIGFGCIAAYALILASA